MKLLKGPAMTFEFPKDFSEPVIALISLGEKAARSTKWSEYAELGITSDHIPELIRVIEQIDLFWGDEADDEKYDFAPIHAWRALGQLQAEEAIQPLIELVVWNEEGDADWIMEEIPEVMAKIGPVTIPILQAALLDKLGLEWTAVTLGHCLSDVGQAYPEHRLACIAALESGLEKYADNDENVNAFLISYLSELKAVESLPLIEEAFKAEAVDFSVAGDFEEIQIELGVLKERITPRPRFNTLFDPDYLWASEKEERKQENQRKKAQEKKEKEKKKAAKKARKRHKGKRK